MRHSPRHHLLAAMALAGTFILSGCAAPPEAGVREDGPMQKTNPRKHREHVMQAAWRGQPYQFLLEKFGPPRGVMAHPGLRSDRGEIVLYGVRDASSNCIDAFTVVAPGSSHDRIVMDYFCR